MTSTSTPFQFKNLSEEQYIIVNDGVMGGVSISQLSLDQDFLNFEGFVSIDNNGGFASFRMIWPFTDSQPKDKLLLKFKGDGNTYQLRLRKGRNFDGVAYSYEIQTYKNQEKEVIVSLDDLIPTYRGRRVRGAGPISWQDVEQFGILIATKTNKEFRIQLKSIQMID